MKKTLLFLALKLFTIASGTATFGQSIVLETDVPIVSATQLSVDRAGNVYAAGTDQNIRKYNSQGKLLETYSPQKMGEITLLESWNSVSTLAFYKDFQEIAFLDRFLTLKSTVSIPSDISGFTRLATIASDNHIWLIDDADFSLKKWNIEYNDLLIHNPLNLQLKSKTYNITFMREYQNNLYLVDEGLDVLVFDILGNYKRTIPIRGARNIGMWKNSMYYTKTGTLYLVDLYSGIAKPQPIAIATDDILVMSAQHIYIARADRLLIYSIK